MSDTTRLVAAGVLEEDVPLGPLTTYKSGGAARFYSEVADMQSLHALIESGITIEQPLLVLGRGSNLVVADRGFRGLVVRLGGEFRSIAYSEGMVTAGGAVALPMLARAVVDASQSGLEFFVGVPGSVGGAVRQNAGCFGEETGDHLISATVVNLATGSEDVKTAPDLDFAYRHSNIAAGEVVVEARFRTAPGNEAGSRTEMRRITRWRKENQPGGTLNAGSVFKNPPEIAAGALIDSLGLKGLSVGGVAVSDKHANFFVANSTATSDDIVRLVEVVKSRVFDETGTILETEIQFVGFE